MLTIEMVNDTKKVIYTAEDLRLPVEIVLEMYNAAPDNFISYEEADDIGYKYGCTHEEITAFYMSAKGNRDLFTEMCKEALGKFKKEMEAHLKYED